MPLPPGLIGIDFHRVGKVHPGKLLRWRDGGAWRDLHAELCANIGGWWRRCSHRCILLHGEAAPAAAKMSYQIAVHGLRIGVGNVHLLKELAEHSHVAI